MLISVKRKPIIFYPESNRTIARFYFTGDDNALQIIKKVLQLSPEQVFIELRKVLRDFSTRHRQITKVFEINFNNIRQLLKKLKIEPKSLSKELRLLIGSYFTHEYSFEAAAYFNPSIVEHPDQYGIKKSQKRIIVSFRATGEGHISSIVFREGIIDQNNDLYFIEPGQLDEIPEHIRRSAYDKKDFTRKLDEMNINKKIVPLVLNKLNDEFNYGELQAGITETLKDITLTPTKRKIIEEINWVADSYYEITFSLDTSLSERVIFPISLSESNGIEDARFVRFTDDDGTVIYYATYTAYNGYAILPKLISTRDFYSFKICPMDGKYSQNKDMALFPRKIKGKYVMVGRYDGVNNYIMFSDKINLWTNAKLLQKPSFPWEFIQIGNSGSPIETKEGWLLITHGVGPMRRYSLGAILLDLENPIKVIGHLQYPLMIPNEKEREGYVPNVIYSCGSIIHNNEIIIPYGMSDYASSFATITLNELLHELKNNHQKLN
ncbi:MAG: glycoside hydrolase family 130 protein [Bacteroidetes bacterium]|nr:glycoside hydrolase family 130 protein [Bacteroidota bacterium]MBL7103513.1 glycoside hydrolase family 130 protein [Bacteroidales bacterium]